MYTNIIEFLEARLSDEERQVWDEKRLAEVAFKRKILELQKQWPILVETKPKFESTDVEFSVDTVAYSMTMEYVWLIESEYVKRFGTEPPTAPIVKEMANLYSDHPDFNSAWKI